MTAVPARPRRWPSIVLRVVVALGLLAWALRANRGPIAEVAGRRPDLALLAAAFALYLAGLALSFGRWAILARVGGVPLRGGDAVRLGFIGAFFNFILPGAIAGIFIRAAFLCREHPDRRGPAIAASFVDLIVGLLGLALWACLSGARSFATLSTPGRRMVAAASVLAVLFSSVLGLAFVPALHRRWGRKAAGRRRLARLVAELAATGATYRGAPWVIPLGVVLGMGTHGLYVLSFMAGGRALFPAIPSVGTHFLIVPLVLFSTAIPLPFGALGASEGISGFLFNRDAGYAGGGVAMMAFRAMQVGGAIVGLIVYLRNITQARTLRDEANRLVAEAELGAIPPPDRAGGGRQRTSS